MYCTFNFLGLVGGNRRFYDASLIAEKKPRFTVILTLSDQKYQSKSVFDLDRFPMQRRATPPAIGERHDEAHGPAGRPYGQAVPDLAQTSAVIEGHGTIALYRWLPARVASAKWLPQSGQAGFRKRIQLGQIVIY